MRKNICECCLVVLALVGVSFLFYGNIWQQVLSPASDNQLVIQGESPVYEFVAETVRTNILAGKNPFTETKQVLYPMGWRYALDDVAPINGLYFVLLRPWLDPHQSMMLIALVSVIASGLAMYGLLRTLGMKFSVAGLGGLILAFTPFVSERIGAHPTYVALYLFILPIIFWLKITSAKTTSKWLSAVGLGISLALPFVTNLYFAVMLILLIGLAGIIYGIFAPRVLWGKVQGNWKYFCLAGFVGTIVLSPWIAEVSQILWYGVIDKPSDWRDIVAYSADLTNFIIPSHFNPLYQEVTSKLGNEFGYIRTTFESFVYPGILLLVGLIGYLFIAKKLPGYLKPLSWLTLIFGVIALGPYLQVGGSVSNIPLPYTLIAYIPLIQMARAPGRFIAVVVVLATILAAQVLNYLLKEKITKSWRTIILLLLMGIFLLDQRVVLGPPSKVTLPLSIYRYLADTKEKSPLLEIPFTMRDSIKYFGNQHSHYASYVTLLHHHPIFGVYAGRITNHVLSYYTENPLLGPIGKIIDTDSSDLDTSSIEIDFQEMQKTLNFYEIRHSITKDKEKYSPQIEEALINMNFAKKMVDGQYTLWEREPTRVVVDSFDNHGQYDQLVLTKGWSKSEKDESGRWAMGKEVEVLLKLDNSNKTKWVIEGEAIVEPQKIQVWLNDEYLGKIVIGGSGYSRHELPLKVRVREGVNVVKLRFANTHVLAKIIPGSMDLRPLALHVKYLGLE